MHCLGRASCGSVVLENGQFLIPVEKSVDGASFCLSNVVVVLWVSTAEYRVILTAHQQCVMN